MKQEKPEKLAITSVQKLYEVLAPLDAATRLRVIKSVFELLGIGPIKDTEISQPELPDVTKPQGGQLSRTPPERRMTVIELMQNKNAMSNLQKIVLFAYWREKYENNPRFSRDDLKQYFKMAKEAPPKNFDRDFVNVVKRGWIHEDGTESYITSKGLEVVESGFERKRMGKEKRTTTDLKKKSRSRKPVRARKKVPTRTT